MAVRIPEVHHSTFRLLSTLSGSTVDALSDAIGRAGPIFSLSKFTETIGAGVEIEPDDLVQIVEVLVTLYGIYDGVDQHMGEFVDGISSAARRQIRLDDETQKINKEQLASNLVKLLRHDDSLGVTAKALNVMIDHEHIFRSSRIMSDFRPVFGNTVESKPIAATIVHMMRIDHSNQTGRSDSITIAMDANDLRELQRMLDRAVKKEASLRKMAEELSLPCLDPSELEN